MKCPVCNKENDDNWTLVEYGDGVCQECWEERADAEWWKMATDNCHILNNCQECKYKKECKEENNK